MTGRLVFICGCIAAGLGLAMVALATYLRYDEYLVLLGLWY